MENHKAAQPYAKAIFDLAHERKQLDRIHDDFEALARLVHSTPELEEFLTDPVFDVKKQLTVLADLFKSRVHPLTFTALSFLTERRKIRYLPQIAYEMGKLYAEKNEILKVHVRSAVKMREDQLDKLCAKLKKHFKKNIRALSEADPSLLGGFKVQAGDLIYDLSAHSQLECFRQQVLSA